MQYVPRSVTVTQSELRGKTTIEAAPDSAQANIYIELARRIAAHENSMTPSPMDAAELRKWAAGWSDQLLALETGEITDKGEKI